MTRQDRYQLIYTGRISKVEKPDDFPLAPFLILFGIGVLVGVLVTLGVMALIK